MNKKLIIFSGVILIVLMLVIAIVSVVMSKKQAPQNQIITQVPSITSVPVQEEVDLVITQPTPVVLSSSPSDGQQQVPVTTKSLMVQLEGTPIQKSEDVIIRIDPPTQFSYSAKEGTIRINFLNILEEGITYSYSVSVNGGTPYIASFKTDGIGPTAKPGIEPPGFYEEQLALQKANNPDVYLSNLMPYTANTFEIEAIFVESPAEHFEFAVTRKGSVSESQVTNEVKKWMFDQGITEAQYSSLDIVYK